MTITLQTDGPSPTYCNTFDGRNMNNTINIQKNTRIGNLPVTNPLIISFDFILHSKNNDTCSPATPTNLCCKQEYGGSNDKTCNLMQFGISSTYDDPQNGVSLPRISLIYDGSIWSWLITTLYQNNETHIISDEKKSSVPFEKKSSFYILFNNTATIIYINSHLYYSKKANKAWQNSIGESHPFYMSNQENRQVIGNISNLCIVTKSDAPSIAPTILPSKAPSEYPSKAPTKTGQPSKTPTDYVKIDCYSESGNAGDTTISCSKSGYIITSCGVILNSIERSDRIFNKGTYIERRLINELGSDGVCHVNYNLNESNFDDTSRNRPLPQARCCNFQQQYKQDFKCRFFESIVSTKRKNEFSSVKCNKEFPYLLSCSARVDEKASFKHFAKSNDDIQFYGIFISNNSESEDVYKMNYYYRLDTGRLKNISYPPPPTPQPTSQVVKITSKIPTRNPTDIVAPSMKKTVYGLRINHKNEETQCIAQHGRKRRNYSVTAIATCCSDSKESILSFKQITSHPTSSPTFKIRLFTPYFGPNGTITKTLSNDVKQRDFIENEMDTKQQFLSGIIDWGIIQVSDETTIRINNNLNENKYIIGYQGILIGKYSAWYKNGTKEVRSASGDYDLIFISSQNTKTFSQIKKCSSFQLDTINGFRDYINGFDIYYTSITVYGITFHTSFGRKYSCPDNEIFKDNSVEILKAKFRGEDYKYLNDTYYEMKNISMKDLFANNSTYGVYKLGGWRGTYQPRELQLAVIRRLYASIGFSFLFDDTINTLSPTIKPTISPISPTIIPTLVPTFAQQDSSEILECYSIFNDKYVECKNKHIDTMTGCNGFSNEGQIFNTYINSNDLCIVSTINNKTAAAIATCCYFKAPIIRDFKIFIYTSITGGIIFITIFIIMSLILFFNIKNKIYFKHDDIDDDTIIDKAVQQIGQNVIDKKINVFTVKQDDIIEMERRMSSGSVGLQAD